MPTPLAHYAFNGGEFSPTLYNRADIEKFELGAAIMLNYFVDYRGGASTRGGTEVISELPLSNNENKLFAFEFGIDVANNYILEFGHLYVRFLQDGGYVLEDAKSLTSITQANPGVATSTAHGFSTGDIVFIEDVEGMVQLNSRYLRVGATTTNTFEVLEIDGTNLDTSSYTAYTSGGTVSRVYTVVSVYPSSDLFLLKLTQNLNTIVLTHPDHLPRELTRNGHTDWIFNPVDFSPQIAAPTNVNVSAALGAGSAAYAYAVTSVDSNGNESLPSFINVKRNVANMSVVEASFKITWNSVTEATYYNVYRSTVAAASASLTKAAELGFVGRAFGASFQDTNIIADFTKTPPRFNNPFAAGAITNIEVTAGGSSYSDTVEVVVTGGGGGGFSGTVVVDSGVVIDVIIRTAGSAFTEPVNVVITDSGGSGTGATATATIGPATGTYPAANTYHQQRLIFASTNNQPNTVFGSQPGQFNNFNFSIPAIASDSYIFSISSRQLNPIRHLISVQDGLIAFTPTGVWSITGEAAGSSITPLSAEANPQTYDGCSQVPPLTINNDVIYTQDKGSIVRSLSFNFYSNSYTTQDLSILSNHFFSGFNILEWTYAVEPLKLVHAVRDDGAMLIQTYVKEQETFAWTQHWTRGRFKNVTSVGEGDEDVVYVIVERFIRGKYRKYLERFKSRNQKNVEDFWCVDCGLEYPLTMINATLSLDKASGTDIIATAGSAVFSSGNVGDVVRAGGGIFEVTAFTSPTQVTLSSRIPATEIIPQTELENVQTPLPISANEWSMTTPITIVSGLWHLEGETVSILADGNVPVRTTVANGQITLQQAASRIIIGLRYFCRLQTLPLEILQETIIGRRKQIFGMAARVNETRGLKVGRSLDALEEARERTTEAYGEPTALLSGERYRNIISDWDNEGQIWFQQDLPLPATILGYMVQVDAGDDND